MSVTTSTPELERRVLDLESLAEKRTLIASRPDLPVDVRASLMKQSIETVRYAVKTYPRGGASRGSSSLAGEDDDPALDARMDRAMGLAPPKAVGFEVDGNVCRLGAISPELARQRLAEIEAKRFV